MHIGLTHELEITVTDNETAAHLCSGCLPVFATPSMIKFMEITATQAVEPYMEDGMSTVGTKVDISHIAATPVSMKVTFKAVLTEIDNRRLVFDVSAYDEKEQIGMGTHERFIINNEKFQCKADAKKPLFLG